MSIQILPPPTSGSNLIGEGLRQGLASGIERGSNIGFQRKLTQEALQNIKPGASAFDVASNLIQATAGIPGAERYVGQLFPLLLQQMQNKNAFDPDNVNAPSGQTNQSNQPLEKEPGQYVSTQGMQQPNRQIQPGQGQAQPQGQNQNFQNLEGGVLPRILTPQEIQAQASRMQMPPEQALSLVNSINQNNINQRSLAEGKALQSGVPAEELPEFMQAGQEFAGERNLDSWLTKTGERYKEYKSAKNALDRAIVPGFLRGAAEKGKNLNLASMGLLGGLVRGGEFRDKALERIHPTVKRLVDMGFENYARQKLANEHLSPTEISEAIHPLSDEKKASINSFPQASKIPEPIREQRLQKFIKDNVDRNTSLLAMRHKLWEKGYDWQEVANVMRQSLNPNELSRWQNTELTDVETQAPKQSLSEIFRDYGNWIDFIRGNK